MLLKLLLIQLDICAFEFTTDAFLLACNRGGVTLQSTELERQLYASKVQIFAFQLKTNINS